MRHIDANLLKEMRFLKKRTGLGEAAVLWAKPGERPPGLDARTVRCWIAGTVREAPAAQLDFVLARWRKIWREGDYLVPITEGLRAKLTAEQERTAVYPTELLKCDKAPPHRLTPATIRHWMSGAQKSARKAHLDWALHCWKSLPSAGEITPKSLRDAVLAPHSKRLVLSERIVTELRALRDESGKGPRAMLAWATQYRFTPPPDLSATIIAQWLGGNTKTISAEHLSFVKTIWSRILECEPRLIPLSAEQRDALHRRCEDGLLPRAIFDGTDDAPEGLSQNIVRYWISRRPVRVREDYLNWVLSRCEAFATSPRRRVRIDTEMQSSLKVLRQKTGIGQTELLRHSPNKPDGLSPQMVSSWINGSIRTAQQAHLDWVREAWDSVLNKPQNLPELDRTIITEALRNELRALCQRTDISPDRLLRDASGVPPGLTESKIRFWLTGRTKSALGAHVDWVLAAW
ncbi:MAG: hypothetical protein HQ481_18120, partial [Alphaproteobacteria bacterium]|nr:hypothetical protein [Alphaproteobacteria bacterium]